MTGLARMADYHLSLLAYDPQAAEAYIDSTRNAMRDAADSDPFVTAVVDWLTRRTDMPWQGSAKDAWEAAAVSLPGGPDGHRGPWWPRDPASFGAAITRADQPLRAMGVEVTRIRSNGGRWLRFEEARS